MQVQSNGKIRRTASEWEALLAAQRSSGLSEAAFCRRKQVSKSSFANWKKRQGRKLATRKAKAPAGFVEVASPVSISSSSSALTLSAGEFELRLPGSVVLRWKP